jgi:hypothetical protein
MSLICRPHASDPFLVVSRYPKTIVHSSRRIAYSLLFKPETPDDAACSVLYPKFKTDTVA